MAKEEMVKGAMNNDAMKNPHGEALPRAWRRARNRNNRPTS